MALRSRTTTARATARDGERRTETMFHMSPPTPSPSMPSLPPPLTPPPREDDVLFNLAGLDVTMLHVYIVTGSALLAACEVGDVTDPPSIFCDTIVIL